MFDRNLALDAMEQAAQKIYDSNENYQANGKRGMLVAQVRDDKHTYQWESTSRAFGTFFSAPSDGGHGDSNDATVHEKIAYVHRTGKNSGEPSSELWGGESKWRGAIVSDDGRFICGFSGFSEADDLVIAEAGIKAFLEQC